MTEKIAIVTGGTSGIGLCTAAALQKQGCKVYTISRREFSDPRFTHIRADVTDPEAAERAAEVFSLLIGFIGRELGRTGVRPSAALGTARNALAEWQGGIMLAHGLKDATVLAESFRRMERLLVPMRG